MISGCTGESSRTEPDRTCVPALPAHAGSVAITGSSGAPASSRIALPPVSLTGVNLPSAVFTEPDRLPGVYGTDYTYPAHGEIDYFLQKGMNVIRLAFQWETLQPTLMGPLDKAELGRIDDLVAYTTKQGASVILDPHNYARYQAVGPQNRGGPSVIGSEAVPFEAFADLWTKVAGHFRSNKHVIFGLMNEPHDMPTTQWREAANVGIAAIRAAGAANLILVPGNDWTGGADWGCAGEDSGNSVEMVNVRDSGASWAFEIHQYLDEDGSGHHPECVDETVGSRRLAGVTSWLRDQGRQAVLGEFGGGGDPVCLAAINDIVAFIERNADVWRGWVYWAGGPWLDDEFYSIEPNANGDRPQMEVLERHLSPSSP